MSPVHPVFWRENIVGSVRAWGWSWKRHTPEATEFATLAYVIKSNNYRHIITMISKIIVVVSQNSCWTKWKYWTYWKCCWNRHGMCHASIAYYVMNAGKHEWCTAYCSSKNNTGCYSIWLCFRTVPRMAPLFSIALGCFIFWWWVHYSSQTRVDAIRLCEVYTFKPSTKYCLFLSDLRPLATYPFFWFKCINQPRMKENQLLGVDLHLF